MSEMVLETNGGDHVKDVAGSSLEEEELSRHSSVAPSESNNIVEEGEEGISVTSSSKMNHDEEEIVGGESGGEAETKKEEEEEEEEEEKQQGEENELFGEDNEEEPPSTTNNSVGNEDAIISQTDRTLLPTLRGIFSDATGIWQGNWAMTAAEFETGLKGDFEYKRAKKFPAPPRDGPPTTLAPGQPRDMFISGWFTLLENGKKRKVQERFILIRFTSVNDIIKVEGSGQNKKAGKFSMSGTFDTVTGQLNMEKVYHYLLPKPPGAATTSSSIEKPKKKPISPRPILPRATPKRSASIQHDPTWGSANPAPRMRRSSSNRSSAHEDEAVENQKNVQKMLPIVQKLLDHDKNQFFAYPVDPVALNLPTYNDIISEPMDLGTIKKNILNHEYETEEQVIDHIKLTFSNAMLFNPKQTFVHTVAKQLLSQYEAEREKMLSRRKPKRPSSNAYHPPGETKRSKKNRNGDSDEEEMIGVSEDDYSDDRTYASRQSSRRRSGGHDSYAKFNDVGFIEPAAASASNEELQLLRKKLDMMSQEIQTLKQSQFQQIASPRPSLDAGAAAASASIGYPQVAPKRQRALPKPKTPHFDDEHGLSKSQKIERPLSYQEKRALGQDINKLPGDKVQRVIDIIIESGGQMGGDGAEEVEIDIEKLDTTTLKTLQKYVREVLRVEKKKAIKDGTL